MIKTGFHIQKGGVGKTSLSGNIADLAARQGVKVALVDADPQANTSTWFLGEKQINHELADVLQEKVDIEDALVKVSPTLFVLPTFAIGGNLKLFSEMQLLEQPYIFETLLEKIEDLGFELTIFDLSPGMSRLEKAVILALDEVITPLTPEYFSIDGVEIFRAELRKLNEAYRREIIHRRIVCNAINRGFRRHRKFHKHFEDLNYELYTVAQDAKIPESQVLNMTLFEYYPKAKTIPELRRLAAAIMGGNHANKKD